MRKKIISVISLCIAMAICSTNALATNRDVSTWVPSWGSSSARTGSYSGSVRMYMDFGWDSNSSISGLMADSNETLEMDLVFYNYDGDGYVYGYYGDDTQGTYWETNQPMSYHDTDFDDDSDEPSYCIGCSDANEFEIDTYYYWWCYGIRNSSGSMAKIVAQRGKRIPSSVYNSCWNVFSEQSEIVAAFSEFDTPGSIDW